MRACVVLVVVLFTAVCTNASSPLQPDAPKHQEHSTAIQPVSLYLIDECNHLDHLSDDSDEADLSVEREALGQPDEPRVACAKASSLFDALKDAGKGFLKRAFSFEQQKKERSQEQDAILRGERHVYESTPELRGALATSSPPASPSPSQSTSLVEVANPVLRSPARLWPHGVIPFYFKQESPRSFFEAVEMTGFIRAAAELTRETNLRVVPVARPDRFDSADVVEVRTSDKLIGGECSSPVGRRGRVQGLIITDMCFKSASLHELLHTAGFTHTHARQDRDAYVTYRPDNMADPTEGYNFDKTNPEYWKDVGPFSLDSIMLYGTHSFSKSIFHPTLMPKFGWSKGSWKELGLPAPIDSWLRLQGFRTKLGEADIDAVNQVYPPDETPLSEIEAFKSGALKVDEAAQARKSATYRIAKIISQHELVFDPDSKVQLGMWKTVEEALQKKSVAIFNAIAAVINKAAKERPSARAYEVVIADQGPAENKMYATLRGGFIADMFKQAGVKVSAARPPLLYHLRCSGVEHEGVWSCNNHARGDGIPSVRVFVLKPRADVLTPATQAPST